MNGQTRKTINLPLPGGATAVYDTTFHYRYGDWLGSSRFSSTASRTKFSDDAYAPYGENYAESGTVDPSFTGNDQDTVPGTYDFLYREYNANQGRWISPDPAGLGAVSLGDPQTWNRYAYVRNSPLNSVDPLGLRDCLVLDKNGNSTVQQNCPEPPDHPDTPAGGNDVAKDGNQDDPFACGGYGNGPCGGNGTAAPPAQRKKPANHGITVKRNFSRNFACSSTAAQVMQALENNFSGFGNTTGGNTFTIFSPGPVSVGQETGINVGLQAFGKTFAYSDVSVVVQSASSSSLVFQSMPSHVLYPATVSFSATDIGNGQINFTTSVNATTNGFFGTAAFIFGGKAGETNTWNNLLNNVGQFCSNQ